MPTNIQLREGEPMHRSKTLIALALALSAGSLFALLGPAQSQAPGQRTTIQFFEPNRTAKEYELDLGRQGFTPGDGGTSKAPQFDPETCEKNGTVVGQFTYLAPAGKENGFFSFNGAALLPDGKLTFHFVSKFTDLEEGATGAITGGTGPYKDARGDVTIVEDFEACDKKGALATADLILQ